MPRMMNPHRGKAPIKAARHREHGGAQEPPLAHHPAHHRERVGGEHGDHRPEVHEREPQEVVRRRGQERRADKRSPDEPDHALEERPGPGLARLEQEDRGHVHGEDDAPEHHVRPGRLVAAPHEDVGADEAEAVGEPVEHPDDAPVLQGGVVARLSDDAAQQLEGFDRLGAVHREGGRIPPWYAPPVPGGFPNEPLARSRVCPCPFRRARAGRVPAPGEHRPLSDARGHVGAGVAGRHACRVHGADERRPGTAAHAALGEGASRRRTDPGRRSGREGLRSYLVARREMDRLRWRER